MSLTKFRLFNVGNRAPSCFSLSSPLDPGFTPLTLVKPQPFPSPSPPPFFPPLSSPPPSSFPSSFSSFLPLRPSPLYSPLPLFFPSVVHSFSSSSPPTGTPLSPIFHSSLVPPHQFFSEPSTFLPWLLDTSLRRLPPTQRGRPPPSCQSLLLRIFCLCPFLFLVRFFLWMFWNPSEADCRVGRRATLPLQCFTPSPSAFTWFPPP